MIINHNCLAAWSVRNAQCTAGGKELVVRTQLTVTYNVSRGKSQALSPVFDNQNVYRVGDRQSSAPQLSLLTS